jgi:hypothetical protein
MTIIEVDTQILHVDSDVKVSAMPYFKQHASCSETVKPAKRQSCFFSVPAAAPNSQAAPLHPLPLRPPGVS